MSTSPSQTIRQAWPRPALLAIVASYGIALLAFFRPMQSSRFRWAGHLRMITFVFCTSVLPLILSSLVRRAKNHVWMDLALLLVGLPVGTVLPFVLLISYRNFPVSILGVVALDQQSKFDYWGETMFLQQLVVLALAQVSLWTAAALLRKRL